MEFRNKNKKAFTLLLASLLAGLLLAIGVGIFNIVFKEIQLTTSARESQTAFYAADTGIECALYWDLKIGDTFATSSASNPPSSGVDCVSQDIATTWTISNQTGSTADTVFDLDFPSIDECSTVTISKTNSGASTSISSRGYNTCDTTNLRRVERGIEVSY